MTRARIMGLLPPTLAMAVLLTAGCSSDRPHQAVTPVAEEAPEVDKPELPMAPPGTEPEARQMPPIDVPLPPNAGSIGEHGAGDMPSTGGRGDAGGSGRGATAGHVAADGGACTGSIGTEPDTQMAAIGDPLSQEAPQDAPADGSTGGYLSEDDTSGLADGAPVGPASPEMPAQSHAGATETSASGSVASAGSRHKDGINPAQIPGVPVLAPSPPAVLSQPTGIKAPTTPRARAPRVTGTWRQTAGGSTADFLPGGYIDSVLIFRADLMLEVKRRFKSGVTQVWRVGYQIGAAGDEIVLGADKRRQPAAELLRAFVSSAVDKEMAPPAQAFPATLGLERLATGELRLGDKTYSAEGH